MRGIGMTTWNVQTYMHLFLIVPSHGEIILDALCDQIYNCRPLVIWNVDVDMYAGRSIALLSCWYCFRMNGGRGSAASLKHANDPCETKKALLLCSVKSSF